MPVKLSDRTSTFGKSDIYSTHDSNRGALGFHAVNSTTERNQIPYDRRRGSYQDDLTNYPDEPQTPYPFFVCVRTLDDVKLWWLKNEPGTATTQDSDWEEFVAGSTDPFQGFFNPNATTLVDGVGTKGHYWIASVSGSHNFGSGIIDFAQYDEAKYDGTVWQKVGGATAVADWNTMINKPPQFPPTSHQHYTSDIINLDIQLNDKVPQIFVKQDVLANATNVSYVPSTYAVAQYTYPKATIDDKISNLSTYGIKYSWINSSQQLLQTGMLVGDLGLRQDEQKVYKWSGTGWGTGFFSLNSGGKLTENITSDVAIGGIQVGELLPVGMTFTEFVKALLKTTQPAVYYQPTFNLLLVPDSTYYEIGSEVTIDIYTDYAQNDAGAVTNYALARLKDFGNTVLVNSSSTSPYTDTFLLDTEYPVSYMGAITFAAGPVKNDSSGNPSPTGKIQETTLNHESALIIPARKLFYGYDSDFSDSDAIRNLEFSTLNPTDGMMFNMNIPQGTTRVVFAYPASLGLVEQIFDNGSGFPITEAFTEFNNFEPLTVAVEGANGYAAANYYVYMYYPYGIPLDAVTYTVTI